MDQSSEKSMTQPSEWEKKRDDLKSTFKANGVIANAFEEECFDRAWAIARSETLKEVAEAVKTLEILAHEIDLSDWQLRQGSSSIAFFQISRGILEAIAKLKEK